MHSKYVENGWPGHIAASAVPCSISCVRRMDERVE